MYTSIGSSVCVVCPVSLLQQQLNCSACLSSSSSSSSSLTTTTTTSSSSCFLLSGSKRSWPVSPRLRSRISRIPILFSDFALQRILLSAAPVASPRDGKASASSAALRASSAVRGKEDDNDGDDDVYVRSFSGNERDGDRYWRGTGGRSTSGEKREESKTREERIINKDRSSLQTASSSSSSSAGGRRQGSLQGERKPWRKQQQEEERPRRASSQRERETNNNNKQRRGGGGEGIDNLRGRDTRSSEPRKERASFKYTQGRRERGGAEEGSENRVGGRLENGGSRRRRREGGGEEGEEEEEEEERESFGGVERWEEKKKKMDVEDLERRKRKKEPAVAEQVEFATPMSKQPRIAILGGGMSGLVCALTLEELGIPSTVFDTGKHGLGGRMATRDIETREGRSLVFDHAAQYFTVSDPRFRKLVDRWIKEGAVKEWTGVVGTLRNGGQFKELLDGRPRYVGAHGMRPLADHMASQGQLIEVRRPVWISRMNAFGNSWQLSENGRPEGAFDAVVIAHNGKCANRLLAPSGAPLVFKQMKRLELSSIWALMAAFDEPLPSPLGLDSHTLDGAFVEGINAISWMINNTSKLTLSKDRAPQCWTFFSTAAFGKKNKVPQESIPVVKSEKVKREMLRGVELALGLPEGSMPVPFYVRPQLWGAALPVNTPGVPCIFDARARVGICGDWLLGSSLEAAALSGMALAHHIAEYRDRGDLNPEEFSIGLDTGFSNVEGQDIGQFPGSSCSQASRKPELVASAH